MENSKKYEHNLQLSNIDFEFEDLIIYIDSLKSTTIAKHCVRQQSLLADCQEALSHTDQIN